MRGLLQKIRQGGQLKECMGRCHLWKDRGQFVEHEWRRPGKRGHCTSCLETCACHGKCAGQKKFQWEFNTSQWSEALFPSRQARYRICMTRDPDFKQCRVCATALPKGMFNPSEWRKRGGNNRVCLGCAQTLATPATWTCSKCQIAKHKDQEFSEWAGRQKHGRHNGKQVCND